MSAPETGHFFYLRRRTGWTILRPSSPSVPFTCYFSGGEPVSECAHSTPTLPVNLPDGRHRLAFRRFSFPWFFLTRTQYQHSPSVYAFLFPEFSRVNCRWNTLYYFPLLKSDVYHFIITSTDFVILSAFFFNFNKCRLMAVLRVLIFVPLDSTN